MESTPLAYGEAYRSALQGMEELAEPLSASAFNWKPDPDTWSVAECFEHLVRTNGPYLTVFEKTIAHGRPKGTPPFQYGWFARQFIGATSPKGRPVKTFGGMKPGTAGSAIDKPRVMDSLRSQTTRLEQILASAEGLDLSRIRVRSPFVPILYLPIGAFLEALAGHEHRHLAQARRLIQHTGFPQTESQAG